MTGTADRLAANPDLLPPPSTMPLIVDTDIGGDPDDAVALAVAAGLPELALVITSDEHGDRRARFARHLLDALGRPEVPVVAGIDLGNEKYWAADGLTPIDTPDQSRDVIGAVRGVLDRAEGKVRWLGIGPPSNLANVLTEIPESLPRLVVTQMGGAMQYRHDDRAEHNIRLDVAAARTVLAAGPQMWIVPSDVTFHAENEITSRSPEYELLAGAGGPWTLIQAHMDQWFANFHPGTMQHDALALAQAMLLPFLRFGRTGVGLDDIGRMTPGEHTVFLVHRANYTAFRTWLQKRLTQGIAAGSDARRSLKPVGIYREMYSKVREELPSLRDSQTTEVIDDRDLVVRYMDSATVVFDVMGPSPDLIDGNRSVHAGPSLVTDGEWVWRLDSVHYLREYPMEIPEEFLRRVRSLDYRPAAFTLTHEIADAAIEAYF
ncbi:nucleoside hydrolase [Nocardia sp. NPDC057668]|uniref:nucleoside hydrolase n=1 Tax=Nocardia sp. NPDC057668 TaxID=3346202 RepID=UPI00366DFF46